MKLHTLASSGNYREEFNAYPSKLIFRLFIYIYIYTTFSLQKWDYAIEITQLLKILTVYCIEMFYFKGLDST